MTELDELIRRRDELLALQQQVEAKLKSRPHDFGVYVWCGFLIMGLLIGWIRAGTFWSILLHGFLFWITGVLFCVFPLDSAEVQSRLAILLLRLGAKGVSQWLYERAIR